MLYYPYYREERVMSEIRKRWPLLILVLAGGAAIIWFALQPNSQSPSGAVVKQGQSQPAPTPLASREAYLPPPDPSHPAGDIEPTLPPPILTPESNVESSYPDSRYAAPGKPITYTLNVYNSSSAPAYNLVITDHIPSGLTHTTCMVFTGGSCHISDGQAIYRFADPLPVQQWAEGLLRGELAPDLPHHTNLTNAADVSYSSADRRIQRTTMISNTTIVFALHDIPISITANHERVERNQLITYTIALTNSSDVALDQVHFSVALPAALQTLGCATDGYLSRQCEYDLGFEMNRPHTATFFGGQFPPITLAPHLSRVLTLTTWVRLDAPADANLTVTAQAFAPLLLASASSTVSVARSYSPQLLLNSSDYSYTGPGAMISMVGGLYPDQPNTTRINYRNIGGSAAYSLVITDTLPRGFVATQCGADAISSCAMQEGQIVYHFTEPLLPNKDEAIGLTIKPTAATPLGVPLTTTMYAEYRDQSGNIYHASADGQSYTVFTPTTMTIMQSDGVYGVRPGQLLTYTIAVTNTGSRLTDAFYIADYPPTGTTYVGCAMFPHLMRGLGCGEVKDNYDGRIPAPHIRLSLDDEGPNLDVGQSMTATVTVRVNPDLGDGISLINRAVLYYNGSADGVTSVDVDTVQAGTP